MGYRVSLSGLLLPFFIHTYQILTYQKEREQFEIL